MRSRLQRAIDKKVRLCVGLISGTSADAAEAAVCRVSGSGPSARLRLVKHRSLPFPRQLRERLLGATTIAEVSELNFTLGELFAKAALTAIRAAGLKPSAIDVIGSHGQTVAHLPPGFSDRASTLQIGEASVIAERTRIPTISDFRTRDVAAGGHGAPLTPYLDWVLFRKKGAFRAFQNLGGIGNLSVIGQRLDETLAFDTGPGNMILDGLASRATAGRLLCDLDGQLSRQGSPLMTLLAELLRHPFLTTPPPRSAGRELFGEVLVSQLWKRFGHRPYDLIATALAFTVEATARAYETWIFPRFPKLEAIYFSGGGSRNPSLMAAFRQRLTRVPLRPLGDLGFPEEAKEAACFALLASECLSNRAQNVPSVTGSRHPVVLGKIVP